MGDQFKSVAELRQSLNPHKGDVPFEVAGQTYTLCYSHLALVKLEKALDKSVVQVMREFENTENMRIGTVVALLWAGLQKHHPAMSFDDAAALLDEAENGAASAIEVIGNSFQKAFNAPGTKGTNPPLKVNGTGTPSGSSTSVTATTPMSSGPSPRESGS